MVGISHVVLCALMLHSATSVKVKVVMHSEQDESKIEDEEPLKTEINEIHEHEHEHRRFKAATVMPFLKHQHKHAERVDEKEYDEEKEIKTTTVTAKPLHPNDLIFPLIYRQSYINSMFKFGENWYTWSTEKRTDGSKGINYYICYDEPKHCDEVGWERTDSLPKCAFQIEFLLPDDRACVSSFGVESHSSGGICDGTDQMKVPEMVHSCGPRIRSLWRFYRIGRRPANAPKPADVNSLICEDEEECYVTIEYRIHHDRITFSLHEPTRGLTFKSALKRDFATEEERVTTAEPTVRVHVHKSKKHEEVETKPKHKKAHTHSKSKVVEGKGVVKEHNDSGYRRTIKNKIKVREDVSEDTSE